MCPDQSPQRLAYVHHTASLASSYPLVPPHAVCPMHNSRMNHAMHAPTDVHTLLHDYSTHLCPVQCNMSCGMNLHTNAHVPPTSCCHAPNTYTCHISAAGQSAKIHRSGSFHDITTTFIHKISNMPVQQYEQIQYAQLDSLYVCSQIIDILRNLSQNVIILAIYTIKPKTSKQVYGFWFSWFS